MIMAIDRYLSINWAVQLWSIKLRKGKIQIAVINLQFTVHVTIVYYNFRDVGDNFTIFDSNNDFWNFE